MLFAILDKWAGRAQHKEIDKFIGALATLTDLEMAELLLVTTDVRRGIQVRGINLLDPFASVMFHPTLTIEIARAAETAQKGGNAMAAAAYTVWGHTCRAMLRRSLLPKAQLMWRELGRAHGKLALARMTLIEVHGVHVDIEDADAVPLGLC